MVLKRLMEKCEKYQTKGCESCPWRDSLEDCLTEVISDYTDSDKGVLKYMKMEEKISVKPMLMQFAEPEYMCECGCKFYVYGEQPSYCSYCGLKFDWSI